MKKFRLIDNSFRKKFKSLEFNILFFKIFIKNKDRIPLIFLKKNIRILSFKLKLMRMRSVCTFTGRTKSVYKYFRSSRLVLKGLSSIGYIPGVQRLS